MKPVVGFFTALALFVWIQPLGAFIRPADEAVACGGQRAIHMCSVQFAVKSASGLGRAAAQKVFFTASSSLGAEKSNPSSGSGVQMENAASLAMSDPSMRRLTPNEFVLPAQIFFSPATPVPKR